MDERNGASNHISASEQSVDLAIQLVGIRLHQSGDECILQCEDDIGQVTVMIEEHKHKTHLTNKEVVKEGSIQDNRSAL